MTRVRMSVYYAVERKWVREIYGTRSVRYMRGVGNDSYPIHTLKCTLAMIEFEVILVT